MRCLERRARFVIYSVDFIEDEERISARADRLKGLLCDRLIFSDLGIARVEDVKQKVGFARFLERRTERGDELMREPPNKTHRIGDEDLRRRLRLEDADRGLKGREERIFDIDLASRERAEERGFSGVRIPNERYLRQRFSMRSLRRPRLTQALELAL